MFQIAYIVICISFVESSVNGSVIINNKDDESSRYVWNYNATKTALTEEQREKNYINLSTDTKTPIPVSDLVLALEQEVSYFNFLTVFIISMAIDVDGFSRSTMQTIMKKRNTKSY